MQALTSSDMSQSALVRQLVIQFASDRPAARQPFLPSVSLSPWNHGWRTRLVSTYFTAAADWDVFVDPQLRPDAQTSGHCNVLVLGPSAFFVPHALEGGTVACCQWSGSALTAVCGVRGGGGGAQDQFTKCSLNPFSAYRNPLEPLVYYARPRLCKTQLPQLALALWPRGRGCRFFSGLHCCCVVCRLPEHIAIQKVQWCPHGARFCSPPQGCPHGHPPVSYLVTERCLWSYRPLTSQFSSCAVC